MRVFSIRQNVMKRPSSKALLHCDFLVQLQAAKAGRERAQRTRVFLVSGNANQMTEYALIAIFLVFTTENAC